ncbi:hypothetical protein D3C72_1320010 [compost metagenome]
MRITRFLAFTAVSISLSALAQVPTQTQCEATVRARAPMSVDKKKIKTLCEENSMAVIDCTITQVQGSWFTANFESALKRCRADWND